LRLTVPARIPAARLARDLNSFVFDLDQTMPNTPSAIKRLKQSVKRRMHNRITKKIIKTYVKRTLTALDAKDLEKAAADYRTAVSKIDKAGARRVLHPNTAARRKSKLDRLYQAGLAKAKV
jgi:small subunit ribosomal protein S20